MENQIVAKNSTAMVPGECKADDLYLDERKFEMVQRVAKLFSSSDMVPKTFQGKIGNCVIALEMANRLKAGTLEVMQNMYVVHGTPALSGKFIHALFNRCGEWTRLSLDYEYQGGEVVACTASSTHKATGKEQHYKVTWDDVVNEGWDKPKGTMKSKWVTARKMMFGYRAASLFVKIFAPEVILGMPSEYEMMDVGEVVEVESAPTFLPQDNEQAKMAESFPEGPPEEVPEPVLYDDLPPLDGNWWEVVEHWKFRKAFDFLLAVMAGFNMPYPTIELRIAIDGKEYPLDAAGAEAYDVFKEKNPNAVGTLKEASEEYMVGVRKKFVFSMKIDPDIWEILESQDSMEMIADL